MYQSRNYFASCRIEAGAGALKKKKRRQREREKDLEILVLQQIQTILVDTLTPTLLYRMGAIFTYVDGDPIINDDHIYNDYRSALSFSHFSIAQFLAHVHEKSTQSFLIVSPVSALSPILSNLLPLECFYQGGMNGTPTQGICLLVPSCVVLYININITRFLHTRIIRWKSTCRLSSCYTYHGGHHFCFCFSGGSFTAL